MADASIHDLTALTSVNASDELAIVDDPAGTPITKKITVANLTAGLQPLDSELTALAGVTAAADTVPYFSGASTAATTALSAFIRTLLDDADATTAAATLGVIANALLTTRGDIIRRGASAPQRLALGTARQQLVSDGTDAVWGSASGCEVSRASQSITTSTDTAISFTDADTSDTDAYHNPSSNASRVVAPFTGRYLFTCTANHEGDTNTAGARRFYIDKNGAGTHSIANTLASGAFLAGTAAGTGNACLTWAGRLTAGDYLEFFYFQSSGSSRAVEARASMEFLGV